MVEMIPTPGPPWSRCCHVACPVHVKAALILCLEIPSVSLPWSRCGHVVCPAVHVEAALILPVSPGKHLASLYRPVLACPRQSGGSMSR